MPNFLQSFSSTQSTTVRSIILSILIGLMLAGCGSPRKQPDVPAVIEIETPAPVEEPIEEPAEEPVVEPIVITQGLDPDQEITSEQLDSESPWDLVLQAEQATPNTAIELRLSAIEGFLALDDYTSAETQVSYLVDAFLTTEQYNKLTLSQGRIAYGRGLHDAVIQYIAPLVKSPRLDDTSRSLALQTLSESYVTLNRRVDALVSLFMRDQILDREEQLSNQQSILSLVRTLNPSEQVLIRQESLTHDRFPTNYADGWFAFEKITALPLNQQAAAAYRWKNSYPNHPARDELLLESTTTSLDQYNQITILLPLTSPYAHAAQAFYDGFIEASNQDTSLQKPAINIFDIGSDTALIPFYYQSAVNEGADFIVGPLGRAAVTTLLNSIEPQQPTLVLGDVDTAQQSDNLYGLSLSPEAEAEQVALRAFATGHRQAVIFRNTSTWGTRSSEAFTTAWTNLGGTIVHTTAFPDNNDDYSRIIQTLFELNLSVAREKILAAQLGINLQFSPRRRGDFDFIFLAADAKQTRLLVPQLRFFQAHDLPIYATSKIFTGEVNPAVDADLDRLIFSDLYWMLDLPPPAPKGGTEELIIAESEPITPLTTLRTPYRYTPLDRLYALGFESYQLIPRLTGLRQDNLSRYNGEAFRASVRAGGTIQPEMSWATFKDGYVELLDQTPSSTISE